MDQARIPQEENEERRPLGTLACITTGFEVVARNPQLIVMPLLLDLFLWLGPRLSIAPVVERVRTFSQQWMVADASIPQAAEGYTLMRQGLDKISEGFNLFSMLQPAPLLGVPVLSPLRMTAETPLGQQPAVELSAPIGIALLVVVLSLAGLFLSALYLRGVGRTVADETDAPVPGPARFAVLWWALIKLVLLLFSGLFIASTALAFVATIVGLISMPLAGLILTLASSMGLFIVIHLLFTIPGIVQLRRGVLRAMQESLILTRSDFLSILLLLGLIFIISQGLNVVWTLPASDTWSSLIGLAGHAFVSTALTSALFVFYQERLNFLKLFKQLYAAKTTEATIPPVNS